jgi:hypothetical protein
MVGCTAGGDGDCAAAGLKSCTGGANANKVCTVAGDCPGGTCDLDKCTGIKTRECFPDNGVVGGTTSVSGQADPPVNGEADPTLAAIFCIGPTSSSAVNGVAGLPGLGRLALQGHARELP